LHTSSQAKNQVQGGLLLDVVIGQSATVLQLLSGEDQSLLVRGNSFLVLDLRLHVIDGVGALNLKRDGLASQGLHKYLHTSSQAKNQVQGGLLLDVVIGQSTAVLQLLSGEDQSLLVRGDSFLVLDLRLYVIDRIGALDL